MKIYRVGGAVRDQLLDLPFSERDWVVTGAAEQQMLDLGYRRADAAFPVFLHPQTGEEYALARTEIKAGRGYKGFEVYAGPDVTLEQDLARRDLTINAIAMDADGRVIDPFDGQGDLQAGLLRHVTPAFVEDPLRLLRTARFAAQLGRWGFRVAHVTHGLMQRMASREELETLSPERLWREMRKALESDQPWRFFEVLHRCGALRWLIPELEDRMGEPGAHGQDPDAGLAPLKRLKTPNSANGTRWPSRFAAAFFGVAPEAEIQRLGQRLRAQREGVELLQLAQGQAGRFGLAVEGDADAALELFRNARAFQHPERFQQLISVWSACLQPSTDPTPRLMQALHGAQSVNAADLQARGLAGAELGRGLEAARRAAIAAVL